jgi:FKBP-type peptidyl-prolyl cis-trans isomerase FklB
MIVAVSYGICRAGEIEHEVRESKERKDMVSYSLGYQIGGDFKRQGLDINPELVVKGVQDAVSGTKPMYGHREMRDVLVDLKKKMVTTQRAERKNQAQKGMSEGKAFLEKNAKKKGVKTLPSGLQYRVIKEGAGAKPKPADTVTVHYRGTLVDGTEFDSSHGRGEPATFRADRVIAGWKEALQMMKEGARWELFIPPELAYGERGAGRLIGPNSTLIFEVELISVKAAE